MVYENKYVNYLRFITSCKTVNAPKVSSAFSSRSLKLIELISLPKSIKTTKYNIGLRDSTPYLIH